MRKPLLPTLPKETKRPKKKRITRRSLIRFLVLLAVCVLTNVLYRLLLNTPIGLYAFAGFLILAAVLIFTYVIYNRGFSRRGVTREMLPDTMSDEEKDAFLREGEERLKKSAWMLLPIVALCLTFLLDAMELIVIPTWKDMLS